MEGAVGFSPSYFSVIDGSGAHGDKKKVLKTASLWIGFLQIAHLGAVKLNPALLDQGKQLLAILFSYSICTCYS